MDNLLIALPTYGSEVKSVCANSLLRLQRTLIENRIDHTFMWMEKTDISKARNLFASTMLARPEFTHLAFVDADMEFRPEIHLRMLAADKAFIGCVCPYRKIDLHQLAQLAKTVDARTAIARSMGFNVSMDDKIAVGTIVKVRRIGAALTMIRREVFQTLSTSVRKDNAGTYGFFDHIDGMSEDYSFCSRWTETGGEIFAVIDEEIGHAGEFVFRGRFLDAASKF
jgi:hypothetical protein